MKNWGFFFVPLALTLTYAYQNTAVKPKNAAKPRSHQTDPSDATGISQPKTSEESKEPTVIPAQPKPSDKRDLPKNDDPDHALLGLVVNGVLTLATLAIAVAGIIQARATKVAADAAGLSAEILKESQRPQIAADGSGSPPKDLADRESPRVRIALTNRGMTPAYDCSYESWIELLPFPFDDFTKSADYFKSTEPFALYPAHAPVIINIPFREGLTEAQRSDMFDLHKFVCVRIRLVYRDAFSPKRCKDFGLYILKDGIRFLPKYNSFE